MSAAVIAETQEQRTDDWRLARAGRITASRFADAIDLNKKTGKPSAARTKYQMELVAEILSGQPRHEISAQAMAWGRDVETYAREAFEIETGLVVHETGFITHPDYPFIGCSPDGLVGEYEGYESKCPFNEAVHIQTIIEGMPAGHREQVQGCMLVTGRKRWHFVSYDPRQAEPYRLHHEVVERDDAYINDVLLPGLLDFWAEVQGTVKAVRTAKGE